MTFGGRLKLLRTETGLTQIELGEKFNLGKTAISLYENDERFPDKEILNKMADFFGCTVDYLLGRSDVRVSSEINPDDIQVAFSSGFSGLNEENKKTAINIIAGLRAKQDMESKNKKDDKND